MTDAHVFDKAPANMKRKKSPAQRSLSLQEAPRNSNSFAFTAS
jgi:hypothetical protein